MNDFNQWRHLIEIRAHKRVFISGHELRNSEQVEQREASFTESAFPQLLHVSPRLHASNSLARFLRAGTLPEDCGGPAARFEFTFNHDRKNLVCGSDAASRLNDIYMDKISFAMIRIERALLKTAGTEAHSTPFQNATASRSSVAE